MASNGTLEVDVEIKSSPDKFWNNIRDSTTLFPKAFPHDYKSIQVLQGDGKAAGSIRQFTYGEGSPIVKVSQERIDAVDEAAKEVSYSVIEGDLLKYYKSFKGKLVVLPKGDGSLVKWSCEYEKASDDVGVPHAIKDFVVKNFKEVDELDLKAN
ncbi:hypothetical protein JCGZ_21787 [Jatropha curcas]|uniref:Bet v I/Major latex protein domain-containing protein n=1 Tax=Jatropha curcas TaxID=180498 RepID=A0A067JBV9_JATCU|nr:MLP-like protein 423 [Jatropha curcas]KDP21316.1 hypothetical protein JCGZ_21787 [Jatropha curcas]